MGHNLDLVELMGLPERCKCPRCKTDISTMLDDYDIDCGSPQAKNGVMTFSCYCYECDFEFEIDVKIGKAKVVMG